MKRPARSSVAILAASAILLIGVGDLVGVASAAKPSFSSSPVDYMPATIAGKKVVIDPRSTTGSTTPSCQIPPEGIVVTPLIVADPATLGPESFGGIWDCGTGAGVGTGFVAGLDALDVGASTPKLTKKALYADSTPAEAGSVKATKVKIAGLPVTVFVYRLTVLLGETVEQGGAETVFEVATTELKPHLLVTATTPAGVKPLPYLTAMLKAGAGKSPRVDSAARQAPSV